MPLTIGLIVTCAWCYGENVWEPLNLSLISGYDSWAQWHVKIHRGELVKGRKRTHTTIRKEQGKFPRSRGLPFTHHTFISWAMSCPCTWLPNLLLYHVNIWCKEGASCCPLIHDITHYTELISGGQGRAISIACSCKGKLSEINKTKQQQKTNKNSCIPISPEKIPEYSHKGIRKKLWMKETWKHRPLWINCLLYRVLIEASIISNLFHNF